MKRPQRTASPHAVAGTAPDDRQWPLGVIFALLLSAVLLAYLPSLQGDLLWDDAGHVTHPELQSWSGLWRIWFEPGTTQQYYPLLHSAFWFEHAIWGDASLGYRLVNGLWHALSACLFVAILRRLAIPGALFAGLVFALHPVCVESVAWISEQKNTLSTVFYLTAMLAWLRFDEDRRPARYAVATLWFIAALLTKTVTATLPGALLVVAWWRRGRLSWRGDVLPLIPWLALGLAAGLGTAWFEHTQIGAAGGDFTLSAVERTLLAGRVVWFYLGKLLWPADLTFFYPRWTIDATAIWQWLFPIAALTLLSGLFWLRSRSRAPLAAALLFGGTLFPVLGFVNVYPFLFSYVADHFQYPACLGVIAFLTGTAVHGLAKLRWPGWTGPAVATAVLVTLGGLTWRQSGTYRDLFTLYEATLARNPTSWVAQLNYGTLLADSGRQNEGLPHLQRALELKPDFPETLNTLGNVLNELGRPSEALPLVERALQIQPRFALAQNTIGIIFMSLGRADEGVARFQQAVEIDPNLTQPRLNLGWALANRGRFDEAISQFEHVRRLHPGSADAELKWGITLAMSGRMTDALTHLTRAVELQPEHPEMRYLLGRALFGAGHRREAVEQLEAALNFQPNHPGALELLGVIRQTGF